MSDEGNDGSTGQSTGDNVDEDNVVELKPAQKFSLQGGRLPGETRAEYNARYRREKRAWMAANGISPPKRQKVILGNRNAMFARGELSVDDLDVEELVRGRPRAQDGTFRGAPPKFVPKDFHDACIRELMKRGQELYRDAYLDVVKVFVDVAKDASLEPKDRLRAAQYLWERVEGKVPDKVEVGVTRDPWQTLIDGIVADVEDEAIKKAHEYLDTEMNNPDKV